MATTRRGFTASTVAATSAVVAPLAHAADDGNDHHTLPSDCRTRQAQAFALAVKLSEQGHFTWKEWAASLADELKSAENRGEPDDGTQYYEHWLAALERLVVEKGLTDREAMRERKEAWTEAYLHTPHGKTPVRLHREEVFAAMRGTRAPLWNQAGSR